MDPETILKLKINSGQILHIHNLLFYYNLVLLYLLQIFTLLRETYEIYLIRRVSGEAVREMI